MGTCNYEVNGGVGSSTDRDIEVESTRENYRFEDNIRVRRLPGGVVTASIETLRNGIDLSVHKKNNKNFLEHEKKEMK